VDLPLGALCDACRREIDTRAARLARWVSLGTTALFAAYAMTALPPEPNARLVGAAATLIWFVVARRVAFQMARTWLEERGAGSETRRET
jgi:hypothetical protein